MKRSRTFTCEETGLEYYERKHPKTKEDQKVYFDKFTHKRRFVYRKSNKRKDYLCKHIDENISEPHFCESLSAFGGLCARHGDRTCTKEGCTNPSHKEGFCMKHHPNRCGEEGCKNAVYAHGVCKTHSPNRCEADGCDNPSHTGGLCITHTPKNKCIHGIRKDMCYECSENRDLFCTKCPRRLSPNRLSDITITVCKTCQTENTPFEPPESQWYKKLKKIGEEFGFIVEFYNVIIKTKDGRTINMRRIDYKLKTTKELVYYIIIECDERSHYEHSVCSEMIRLQEVHDQLIARFGFKPMVVIRFNPNYKDKEYLEREMKKALKIVLTGNFKCTDYRGINLYPTLIGYGEKRKQQYEDEPNSKRIKYEGNENENITYI